MKLSFLKRKKEKLVEENINKYITFSIDKYYFALPLETIAKIIFTDNIYEDQNNKNRKLTQYKEQEILVINIKQILFNKENDNKNQTTSQHLIILNNLNEENIFAFPIDSSPIMIEVKESLITMLPENYKKLGNITSMISKIINQENQSPFLLINAEKLIKLV